MKQLYIILFAFFCAFTYAQINESLLPKSKSLTNLDATPTEVLAAPDIQSLLEEQASNTDIRKPLIFAKKVYTNFNLENSGTWSNLENGDKIWRLRLNSEGATSVHLSLSNLYIPENATIHVYSDNYENLQGAYTSEVNSEAQLLSTWPINSSDITIEYYEPASAEGEGSLTIEGYNYGFKNMDLTKVLNESGHCNYDVECGIGNPWDDLKEVNKKSIAMMLNVGSTSGWCTGALINNVMQDGTPYFLTANHCMEGFNANNLAVRFGWISSNTVCASTASNGNGPTYMLINGASLKANNASSDFALLELSQAPQEIWDRVYAGWDRSTNSPGPVMGIHHPQGDVMKVCVDETGVVSTTVQGVSAWQITTAGGGWEIGVTEPGSSGSPIFNQQGHIVGQLLGGAAGCSGVQDNGQYDWYGKFSTSWFGGNLSTNALRFWLDPNNTGVTTLDSYNLSVEDVVSNEDYAITISPNPSSGVYKLTTENLSDIDYNIYNLEGKLIQKGSITNGSANVDIQDKSEGIYLLQLENGKSFKLIKK